MKGRPVTTFVTVFTSLVVIGTAVLAVLLRSGPQAGPTTRNSAAAPLVWDLSGSDRPLKAVGWPAAYTGNVWTPPRPGSLRMALPGGRVLDYDYAFVRVVREDQQVRAVGLDRPGESLDAAYARATAMLKEWGLPGQESLDEWHRKMSRDGADFRRPNDNGWKSPSSSEGFPRYAVAIQWNFGPPNEWSASWGIVFFKPAPYTPPPPDGAPTTRGAVSGAETRSAVAPTAAEQQEKAGGW